MMRTIFLDFDGVLFDTVIESYLLARYAYFGIEPQEEVNATEYNLFHSVRYLITHSWHYYYIMKLISSKTQINDFAQKYQICIENRNKNADSKFDQKFQEKRKDLIQNHFNFWNKLDKPYSFFYKIKVFQEKYNILIVSTKNEEAIYRHCVDYGLNIHKENIIGKNKIKNLGSKHSFLEYYINKNNIKNAIFIDDCKKTIENCNNIPELKCYTANWGYVKDKTDGFSEEEIIKIIKEK